MSESTIAAISTPQGSGGISIVRMSGDKSFDIIKKIFKPINERALDRDKDNRMMRYGHIEKDGRIYDEVMINFMKGPNTYTREDICEINCHGSMISVRDILNLLLDLGCELADRGEFTKRAFLNGRIDLSQAEAVLDIINSTNEISQKQGLKQLSGLLREKIEEIRKIELEALSRIEYSINFTEDGEDLPLDDIVEYMDRANDEITKLLSTANKGKLVKDGIETTIIGKPNVGKSSLLNVLLNENRAIVTDIPGTTRDSITEYINLGNLTLKINDTAGIRETHDEVEKIGVQRSKELAKGADLIIAIFDRSREIDEEDKIILDLLKGKNAIIILNKIDLDSKISKEDFDKDFTIIETSMVSRDGIDKLEGAIFDIFDSKELNKESLMITNLRHERLLNSSKEKLQSSLKDIKSFVPIDCVEVDLRSSYDDLGLIIGETVSDEIMDKVFREFCVGK
ncbi:tRNA uridine-5-carboxymethylaminomethyl(34) synthesis GTPase MnmE [Anaerococcus hydrogenalis]|uniref:tRNA modification GTPase MnmE n=2 Tax=Anaerococcus hydrogenalis TaxID=33029 RepID=F0GYU5_9FIRM|nr:tRNA uridine-5-carboxymethylaminomethyl(34) synthesis GTPase MnmE [Anaerococcus hydrogenalis]EGC84615.1 tRNA modification GTPase TrmE [Anaerococcus hydrogenalis ACS-025-V-Sch4]MDK7695540.1 tRNA uridine-5-carboxymethylaminomethyl(34) synthesis GTPase MnmE [Anaerococcus hydrogenalis]MDK7697230.1 tRNA uridine-5-carboxymethylaminomethyl(34) synthesis GTPase MnmE [Anaerococcus hydrogenalis]MDK7708567.1 tRNA uridine-5-carboxymethylaminomethyl(34) synthesis GTPase MnmE [Anaerococcus hydrogenalis]P